MSETRTCNISIDGKPFSFEVEGEFSFGPDEVLFKRGGVTSNTSWEARGWDVQPFFTPEEFRSLRDSARTIITGLFDRLGYVYTPDFTLEDYHRVVTTREMHQAVITQTRFLINRDLALSPEDIAARIGKAIGRKLSSQNPLVPAIGSQNNEFVILRISRPGSMDFNPLHRDGYMDYAKPTLNCWIPVAGCDANSSLPLIEGSHLWNEKDVCRTPAKGAKIGGLAYHVPGIVESKHGLAMMRPNPKEGEILIFTPFLVHGCAVNGNTDATRFSFELRLFDLESGIA